MSLETSQEEECAPTIATDQGSGLLFTSESLRPSLGTLWKTSIPLFLLLAILYGRVFLKLISDWYNLPDFSHGFLVPVFAALLLWERRWAIRATPPKPTWSGIPLVVAALLILLAGTYGAELFFSRMSFLLLLGGITATLLGWRILRQAGLALAVLVLAIPIPALIFNQITFPLQLLASELASNILPLFGVPILRAGNVIQLPAMQLEVAEACSGIRSLMTLFTLAVFYGHFVERTRGRRLLLALASVPIAVAANSIRIVGTGICVQFWDPDKALGFFHEFSGWVVFLVSFCCLYLTHLAMDLVLPTPKESA